MSPVVAGIFQQIVDHVFLEAQILILDNTPVEIMAAEGQHEESVIASAKNNLEKSLRQMAKEDKNLFVKKMARKINEVSGPFHIPLDKFLAAEIDQLKVFVQESRYAADLSIILNNYTM